MNTLRNFLIPGAVQCRICGLVFMPEFAEDREDHEQAHRRILWGALPFEIREFLKAAGWEAIHDKNATLEQKELGKRAVVFGWWARAISNGIPENQFEPYMAAHLAYLDARASGDAQKTEQASNALKPWHKYGG